METNSFEFLDQIRLQTCDPVLTLFVNEPVRVFQVLIVLSAVPPPDAKTPLGEETKKLP